MKDMTRQALVATAAAVLSPIFIASAAWVGQFVTDGSFVSFLGGATHQQLTAIQRDAESLATQEEIETIQQIASESRSVRIVQLSGLIVRTPDQTSPGWPVERTYNAPHVPEQARSYPLDVDCPAGHEPVAAWSEKIVSHPGETMYTIDADAQNGVVTLAVRARAGRQGYAYVDVVVLCQRMP